MTAESRDGTLLGQLVKCGDGDVAYRVRSCEESAESVKVGATKRDMPGREEGEVDLIYKLDRREP